MTESKLTVRRAAPRDLPRLHELLRQVAEVHHQGRPDLFKAGQRKYTDEQLLEILADDIVHAFEDGRGVLNYEPCNSKTVCNHADAHIHFYCESCRKSFCMDDIVLQE